jgi:hypothetical protein
MVPEGIRCLLVVWRWKDMKGKELRSCHFEAHWLKKNSWCIFFNQMAG